MKKLFCDETLPLITPFKDGAEEKNRPVGISDTEGPIFLTTPRQKKQMIIKSSQDGNIFVTSSCESCQRCVTFNLQEIRRTYDRSFGEKQEDHPHVLTLTDCSNCFAAINNVSIRCTEKTTKVQLCFLRDMQKLVTISYVSGSFNIADVDTKERRNIELFRKLAGTGEFEIAFLSRKECREMIERRRSEQNRVEKRESEEGGKPRKKR